MRGPVDSRWGPVDSRWGPVDSCWGPVDGRWGPVAGRCLQTAAGVRMCERSPTPVILLVDVQQQARRRLTGAVAQTVAQTMALTAAQRQLGRRGQSVQGTHLLMTAVGRSGRLAIRRLHVPVILEDELSEVQRHGGTTGDGRQGAGGVTGRQGAGVRRVTGCQGAGVRGVAGRGRLQRPTDTLLNKHSNISLGIVTLQKFYADCL